MMTSRRSPIEHSLDFSNSSSFSSVSDSSESSSLVEHLHTLRSTDTTKTATATTTTSLTSAVPCDALRLPARRTIAVDVLSIIRTEEGGEPPSPLAADTPVVFSRTQSGSEADMAEERGKTDSRRRTAPATSPRCSFSATRDSASPPTMSSYFCTQLKEEEKEEREELRLSPMSAAASFEDIPTPRSNAGAALVGTSPSVHRHLSPCVSPRHARASPREGSTPSLPTETVAVNAAHALEAHERLCTFSTATMAHYQLLKLTVRQRLFRIYYDKWRLRLTQPLQMPPLRTASKVTQTPPVPLRSVSVGTDFVDVDSFHASAATTPRGRAASALTSPTRQSSQALKQDASPPPRPVSGGCQRGSGSDLRDSERHQQPLPSPPLSAPTRGHVKGAAYSAALSLSPTSSSSAERPSPSPDVRLTHAWTPSAVPPVTEGIAARTKPSRLVDFGRPSEAPRRKAAHVSNPVVAEPRVVPSPERVYHR